MLSLDIGRGVSCFVGMTGPAPSGGIGLLAMLGVARMLAMGVAKADIACVEGVATGGFPDGDCEYNGGGWCKGDDDGCLTGENPAARCCCSC